MDNCPLCLHPAHVARSSTGFKYNVFCEVCGEYLISYPVAESEDLRQCEKRYILSAVARNRYEQGKEPLEILTLTDMKTILDSVSEPSASEAIDLLLKHLSKKQSDRNDYVRLDAHTDYPILYAKNPPDFQYLVDKARDESRYIERNTLAFNVANCYRLSIPGWQRLDELDKQAEQGPSLEIKLRETVDEFIQVTWLPDDFYKRLVDEINQLYTSRLPFSLWVLIRKLFENLVIDILRKKYGTQQLELYYDTSKRRFHDFSVLLQNLDTNQADFHYVAPNLDKSLIQQINQYRETGNSAAHSIDANLTIEQILADRENINYLVQYLLRMLQNI